MTKRMKNVLCLALCALLLTGCCSHNWEEANCEQPRTCIECGKEEGEKGEHDWEKATCEHPKTCSVCGKEKGDLGDHKWKDASCTEPETCKYCGETRGQAAGHRWEGLTCQECGETRENPAPTAPAADAPAAEPPADPAAEDDGSLGIYPEDFLLYMLSYAESFSGSYGMGEVLEYSDDWFVCYVNFGEEEAFKVIMILNKATGKIQDVTLQQMKADIICGDLIALYTVAIAMDQPDPDDLTELYAGLDSAMTTQDVREDTVYEVYELDGYYVQIWRRGAENQYRYEVEVFRPTVF